MCLFSILRFEKLNKDVHLKSSIGLLFELWVSEYMNTFLYNEHTHNTSVFGGRFFFNYF